MNGGWRKEREEKRELECSEMNKAGERKVAEVQKGLRGAQLPDERRYVETPAARGTWKRFHLTTRSFAIRLTSIDPRSSALFREGAATESLTDA